MRIVDFPADQGRPIDRFGSVSAHLLGGVRFEGDGGWAFLALDRGGTLGRHTAVLDQLFVVLDGAGWVAGGDGERRSIRAGQAAFWASGEDHESGTEDGMRIAVLEAASIELP